MAILNQCIEPRGLEADTSIKTIGELSQCRKSIRNTYTSTNTRRNITLLTPFELVLIGDADQRKGLEEIKYRIVIYGSSILYLFKTVSKGLY